MIMKPINSQKGFTLIELLISMGIFVGILFAIGLFGRDLTSYSIRFNSGLLAQTEISQTMQFIIPELRSANQSNTGSYPIADLATTSMTFYSDVDRTGLFSRVRYFLNGTTFQKGVVKPSGSPLGYVTSTEVISDMVHNVVKAQIFSYYDSTATSTFSVALPFPVNVASVRTVQVALVANEGNAGTPSLVGAQSEAQIRNLKYK